MIYILYIHGFKWGIMNPRFHAHFGLIDDIRLGYTRDVNINLLCSYPESVL